MLAPVGFKQTRTHRKLLIRSVIPHELPRLWNMYATLASGITHVNSQRLDIIKVFWNNKWSCSFSLHRLRKFHKICLDKKEKCDVQSRKLKKLQKSDVGLESPKNEGLPVLGPKKCDRDIQYGSLWKFVRKNRMPTEWSMCVVDFWDSMADPRW